LGGVNRRSEGSSRKERGPVKRVEVRAMKRKESSNKTRNLKKEKRAFKGGEDHEKKE